MAIAPTLTACTALATRYRRALRPSARKRPKAPTSTSASIPSERIGAGVVAVVPVVPVVPVAVVARVAQARPRIVVVIALDGASAAIAGRRGVRLAMGMGGVAILRAGQPWLLAGRDALHLLRDVDTLVLMGMSGGLLAEQQYAHACLDGLAPPVELRDAAHDLVTAGLRDGHRLLRPGSVLAQHRHDVPVDPHRREGEAGHQRGDDQQHDQQLGEEDSPS